MGLLLADVAFAVCDAFLISFIITPLCVFLFCSTWAFLDLGIQSNISLCLCIIAFVAILYMIACNSAADRLERHFNDQNSKTTIIIKIYYYAGAVALTCTWRGIWNVFDVTIGSVSLVLKLTVGILSLGVLVAARNVSTSLFTPGSLYLDRHDEPFHMYPTRFQTQATFTPWNQCLLYVADIVFSYGLVLTACVGVWWTVFECEDSYLFSGNNTLSAVVSLIYGYVTYLLQLPIRTMFRRVYTDQNNNSPCLTLICHQCFNIVFAFSVLNIWRGIWELVGIYVYPETEWERILTLHITSSLGLAFLGASRSVGTVSFTTDADGEVLQYKHYLQLGLQNVSTEEEDEESISLLNSNRQVITSNSDAALNCNSYQRL